MGDSFIEREWSVLGPGLAEGLKGAAGQTWQDLNQAGVDLRNDFWGTSSNYLKNHSVDFLAGALITFLNPGKKTAGMLTVWSMRGLAYSTVDAIQSASDPNSDLNAVRARYANAISHEGTAFLSAMPMAMAGGIAGRGLASGVFGANKGAADYFRGDITTAQVKSNLLNLQDNVWAPRKKVLVTDLDGTTFPMFDYLVPALRENISTIASKMSIPEQEVASALAGQRVHPWILEASPLARKFQGTTLEFQEQIVRPFWETMSHNRSRLLQPFPEVAKTLAQARAEGVQVVALTNAPTPLALQRLNTTKLTPHVDHLYAVHPVEPPVSQVVQPRALEFGRHLVKTEVGAVGDSPQLRELPQTASKPDTGGIDAIMRDLGVRPKQMLFVGDSIWKDGLVGEARGIPFLWAKYGSRIDPAQKAFLEGLGRPANPQGSPRAPEVMAEATPPPMVGILDNYGQLLPYLRPHVDFHSIGYGLWKNIVQAPSWKPVMTYQLIPNPWQSSKDS